MNDPELSSRPLRILMAGQAYFREDNGQAAFTVRISRGLAERGHTVMAVAPAPPESSQQERMEEGVRIREIRSLSLPHNTSITLFKASEIAALLKEFQPDIIHFQDHYFISRTLWRMARSARIKLVGSNHFLPENLTENLPIPRTLKRHIVRLLWKQMLSMYNHLQAVSTPTATAAAILRDQGLRPPVTAISCGIDIQRFHPVTAEERSRIRKRFDLPEDIPIFIFVGRIDREKGLDTVLQAFAGLKDMKRPPLLLLGGKGSIREELQSMSRELNIQQMVRFPGFIPAEELPKMLACSDCFIMAGFAELQSIATLEAMACGLPVVAARARALPELVSQGENGFLFTPRDPDSLEQALREFLSSKDQWKRWGVESRKRAEQHDFQQTVNNYIQWYYSISSCPER